MAGIVPSPIWKRIPVEEVFQVNIGDTFFRYASLSADDLGRALYWKGIVGYESETIAVFCSIAQQARVIVDVGACTGLYSLVALAVSAKCRVIAFEPVVAVRERCKLNIAINNCLTGARSERNASRILALQGSFTCVQQEANWFRQAA